MSVHSHPMPSTTAQGDGLTTPSQTFEGFFEANHRRLFTALCLVTGERFEAEEIAQEALVRVFEHWEHVAELADPESYVFRVAMNVFRSRYRRAALAVRRSLALAPRASDDLAAVETRDEVIRLLRPLPPRQRAAVLATSILDLSADEAGHLLGMRPATVRALASRARTRMKDEGVDSG
jgi:RNA polymerase sigma-70 factor (ECF subfamily)